MNTSKLIKLTFIFLHLFAICGCNADASTDSIIDNKLWEKYTVPQTLQIDLSLLKEGAPLYAREITVEPWKRDSINSLSELDSDFDIRHYDVSKFSWNEVTELQMQRIQFDDGTIWPHTLPEGFNPENLKELGMDPGLGIRELHQEGITGKGVNIAIIDQALLQQHEEYKDRLMLYEELHCKDAFAQMHGAAVASIATGKKIGVAPDADLYYIACTAWTDDYYDVSPIADAIKRIIEINTYLPENDKIKVVSISNGFMPDTKGAEEMQKAIALAKSNDLFVLCVNTEMHGFEIYGSGGALLSDPNDVLARLPALGYRDYFYSENAMPSNALIIPQDNRTYASWNNINEYEYTASAGISWTVPWLSGFYALCVQVNPNITPDDFVSLCLETGSTITLNHNSVDYSFGKIINPKEVINRQKDALNS